MSGKDNKQTLLGGLNLSDPKVSDETTDDKTTDDETTEDKAAEVEATEVEYVPAHVEQGGRDFRVEGNDVSDYLGVDPEYMTYASVAEKPFLTDVERYDYTNQYDHLEGNADGDTAEGDTAKDEKK